MLFTMTTSENFLVNNRSRCPQSPYKNVIQSVYIPTILKQNHEAGPQENGIMDCCLIEDPEISNGKIGSTICFYKPDTRTKEIGFFEDSGETIKEKTAQKNDLLAMDVFRNELENDLTDLLEQLELVDDSICEQSKPLKIDPNVLKLDFSKLSINRNNEVLDKFCLSDFSENKRASHHLSGGGLLTDASQDNYENPDNDFSKNRRCKLSGGGLITPESVFSFESLNELVYCPTGVSNFLNQISPSSPLTFDLTSETDQMINVTSGISCDTESTNPFKNSMKDVLESENSFSPTNPFTDFDYLSSPYEISSINCMPPSYENISLPQKSFSQCSTRPTSPEESSVLNPFLRNESSQQLQQSTIPHQFLGESNLQKSQNTVSPLPNSSSFIFAVPVFPIVHPNITDSSTQTIDLPELPKSEERVYQNVTSQLQKFMKRNDHSEYDLQCLKTTVKDLRSSGWYYENVSWQESVVLLKNTEPGTFLIRDSSDPNFLFSLSVQTSRGPTSVRLHYVNGQFRLDAEERLIPHMPSFNSVIELIDYYVENTVKNKCSKKSNKLKKVPGKHKLQKSKDQVWIDSQGNIYSNILLVKPLYKKEHFLTLQHLARLVINRFIKNRLNAKVKYNFRVTPVYESSPFQDSSFQNNFDNFCPILSINSLPLPSKLLDYLKEYPYCH